jgi:hypothetical protein
MKTNAKPSGKTNGNRKASAKPTKPYWKMSKAELREATKEFDQEFIGDTFGPPTAEQRVQDRRARAKRGRPRVGMGSKTISVTVEKRLLAKADRMAKTLKLPRAFLIARGLQAVVSEEVPIG